MPNLQNLSKAPFQAFAEEGLLLVKEGRLFFPLFSGGTYQVEVREKGRVKFWPFLQLTDSKEVKDSFCSCETAEREGACRHLAASLLKIYGGHSEPLHVRFQASLWNKLCQIGAARSGYSEEVFKDRHDLTLSLYGKKLFTLKGETAEGKKKINEILFKRVKETEETSLKFSNLTPEELAAWKKGQPSLKLEYELSFWSDLAKWWMSLQEEGKSYEISFRVEEVPKEITVKFADVSFGFYLAEANLSVVIPALKTVESQIKVFDSSHRTLKGIRYDEKEKSFHFEVEEGEAVSTSPSGVRVGEWIFVKDKGFYPARIDALLQEKTIPSSQIDSFLCRHASWVKDHLSSHTISLEAKEPKHTLFFDKKGWLHIESFLFKEAEKGEYFGSWVFVDKGFHLLKDPLFVGREKVLKTPSEISEFVTHHKHWLHAHDGFQTHITSVESNLFFRVSEEGLSFEAKLLTEEEQYKDFGDWVYLPGKGFYPKLTGKLGGVLKPGLVIPPKEIAEFIRAHRFELEGVPHFFAEVTPVEKSGLNIFFREGRIEVEPSYSCTSSDVQFFEHFTYERGVGFIEIPAELKLPDGYCEKKVIDKEAEGYFVSYEIDLLKPWILFSDPKLRKVVEVKLNVSHIEREKEGWLLRLRYDTELGSVSAFDVWKGLNAKKPYLLSSAGLLNLTAPRYSWMRSLPKKRWSPGGKTLRLTGVEWVRLFAFEAIEAPRDEESHRLFDEFSAFEATSEPDISLLTSSLRPYQLMGLKWLWFLYTYGLSGLLCDEMGLGKTHQAMALLSAISKATFATPSLVVCPTSVLFHWEGLLKRFLPTLKVVVFYGAGRSLDKLSSCDIVLTSYGLLRTSVAQFKEISFEVAIFDEIQMAKNAASRTHKALSQIKGRMRLGLTGTPIENRLLELKALFDIVLPGYLPGAASFKELFVGPIERQNDQEKKELLHRLIKPFVLRRKKSEVLTELPEKIEEVSFVPLSEEQEKLYSKVYAETRPALLSELEDTTKQPRYLHVFALLTKLKQICDHPALFLGKPRDFHRHTSGKWELFTALLSEARGNKQKVVVFSHYLEMLDIIELYLQEEGVGFASLRGSTKDRQGEVERFHSDPACEVFVGSLHAAGVGIDLTAASVVIHYDRWWNPAKENQATDRVHRLGQSRGVQVFKLVTKGSLEEHIDALIERKKGLIDGLVGYDDQDHLKALGRDELLALVRLVDRDLAR